MTILLPKSDLPGSYNYDRPNPKIIPNLARFDYSALAGLNLSWRISSFYTNQHKVAESRLGGLLTLNYIIVTAGNRVSNGFSFDIK